MSPLLALIKEKEQNKTKQKTLNDMKIEYCQPKILALIIKSTTKPIKNKSFNVLNNLLA